MLLDICLICCYSTGSVTFYIASNHSISYMKILMCCKRRYGHLIYSFQPVLFFQCPECKEIHIVKDKGNYLIEEKENEG